MIVRTLSDGSVVRIHSVGSITDSEFMTANPTGGYSSVDSLPQSKWDKWKVVDNLIVSDAEAEAICDANLYKSQRGAEYPSIADQLDDIYHNGIDSWKATVKTIKDAYPKPAGE
jgi:hypothetical protein|tara:strand:- start:460 stop:801 length:342 start_codon:yes stop_codon:yes gene_type:complete